MREKVKELWERCFNDSKEFTDLYFRLRYNNEVNLAIESGEELIAALQMIPYPMTYAGSIVATSYISGACTHPDYRNRGVMHELLRQAFGRMFRNKILFSTLIPAEEWLFDYYAQRGYSTTFHYEIETIRRKEEYHTEKGNTLVDLFGINIPGWDKDYKVECTTDYNESAYQYLNRKLQKRPCCVQHTQSDFNIIIEDLKLSRGCIYTLQNLQQTTNNPREIIALAIAYPDENNPSTLFLGELASDSKEAELILLSHIVCQKNLTTIEVAKPPLKTESTLPLGMARIIQAKPVLQLYAAAHPEVELNIVLTDEEISANNGYYYLNNGKCMFSERRLPETHQQFSIGELAEMVLKKERPYMSLMLN